MQNPWGPAHTAPPVFPLGSLSFPEFCSNTGMSALTVTQYSPPSPSPFSFSHIFSVLYFIASPLAYSIPSGILDGIQKLLNQLQAASAARAPSLCPPHVDPGDCWCAENGLSPPSDDWLRHSFADCPINHVAALNRPFWSVPFSRARLISFGSRHSWRRISSLFYTQRVKHDLFSNIMFSFSSALSDTVLHL